MRLQLNPHHIPTHPHPRSLFHENLHTAESVEGSSFVNAWSPWVGYTVPRAASNLFLGLNERPQGQGTARQEVRR